jgi:hypothetical protein
VHDDFTQQMLRELFALCIADGRACSAFFNDIAFCSNDVFLRGYPCAHAYTFLEVG